jgi:hypothetical protein
MVRDKPEAGRGMGENTKAPPGMPPPSRQRASISRDGIATDPDPLQVGANSSCRMSLAQKWRQWSPAHALISGWQLTPELGIATEGRQAVRVRARPPPTMSWSPWPTQP